MSNRALLVVDMQNGFCHPDGSFSRLGMGLEDADAVRNAAVMRDFLVTLLADCRAAKTRRLHELSLEVLTSYQLAEIARIGDGYDLAPGLKVPSLR